MHARKRRQMPRDYEVSGKPLFSWPTSYTFVSPLPASYFCCLKRVPCKILKTIQGEEFQMARLVAMFLVLVIAMSTLAQTNSGRRVRGELPAGYWPLEKSQP